MSLDPPVDDLPPYLVPHSQEAIRILYEDADLLLVRKPHLLLTIPGRHALNKDCLITRLREHYPSASIVHRLDLDTSGIIAIPLNRQTHAHISRQFQERRVQKHYYALVYGDPQQDSGEIDLSIATDWANRPLQMISAERGKSALTRYEVLERHGDHARVRLSPVTGRSHQLRIHLAAIGHPILGCDLYAHDQALEMSERLMLHAAALSFTHPTTGQRLAGECPPDF